MNQQPEADPKKSALADAAKAIYGFVVALSEFIPEKYRKATLALGAALVALVVAFTGNNYYQSDINVYPATATTINMQDLSLSVPKNGGPAKVVGGPSTAKPVAPLMSWENADVRNGRTLRWFIEADVSTEARAAFIRQMDIVSAAFPPPRDNTGRPVGSGIVYEVVANEQAPYRLGTTATKDCGLDSALGCAVYLGTTTGRLSYNGSVWFPGSSLPRTGLDTVLGHEVQHLILNLDHTPCGPPQSVMTGVDIGRGSSCSQPPAFGVVSEDWGKAIGYYGLNAAPSPSPTPRPTPSPTPAPTPRACVYTVIGQEWKAPIPPSEQWRITEVSRGTSTTNEQTWYTTVVVDPSGTVHYGDSFVSIDGGAPCR